MAVYLDMYLAVYLECTRALRLETVTMVVVGQNLCLIPYPDGALEMKHI